MTISKMGAMNTLEIYNVLITYLIDKLKKNFQGINATDMKMLPVVNKKPENISLESFKSFQVKDSIRDKRKRKKIMTIIIYLKIFYHYTKKRIIQTIPDIVNVQNIFENRLPFIFL